MLEGKSFLDGFGTAIVLMASLHGLLLALILFFNKRLRSKSNRYLAFAILTASVVLSLDIVYYFDIEYRLPVVMQYLPLYWRTAVPVGIFYFIIYLINPTHQLTNVEKSGFAFIALEIFIELLYIPINIFADSEAVIDYWEIIIVMIEQFIGLIACLWFFWLALQRIEKYQKYLFNHYSTTADKSLGWLRSFLWMNFAVTILWLISYIQQWSGYYEWADTMFVLSTIGLGMLSFYVGYYLILKYTWFHVVPIEEDSEDDTQKNKLSSKTDSYYHNVMKLMQEEKLYADVELTLSSLSERLGISAGYLSRIINEKENKNFFEFVNSFRIEEVKQKLVDKDYGHYSILGIALESGFKSKTTFNTVFKKFTGQTPSSYQRQFS